MIALTMQHPTLQQILSTSESGSSILARGLALVHLVGQYAGATMRELSDWSGIPLATTYRIVAQLEQAGYVIDVDGQIHTGTAMSPNDPEDPHIVDLARPALRYLAATARENAILTVRVNTLSLCLDAAAPRGARQASFRVGQSRPLHAGASATPLLAFANEEIIDRVLASQLRRYTSQTPDETALRAKLGEVRRRGYDVTEGEIQPLWTAVGMPVLIDNRPVCCLSLVGPTVEMTDISGFVGTLRDVAAELASTMSTAQTGHWWTPSDPTGER